MNKPIGRRIDLSQRFKSARATSLVDRSALQTVSAEDIRASRVFRQ